MLCVIIDKQKTIERKNMKIRRMITEDYDAAFELWTADKGVGLRNIDDSREGIRRFLERNPETCFAAEENGEVVGTILCGNDGRRGYIYHAMVREDCRSKGIGRELVRSAAGALKALGINKLALVVFSDNAGGIAFWKSVGFSVRDDLEYMDMSLNELND